MAASTFCPVPKIKAILHSRPEIFSKTGFFSGRLSLDSQEADSGLDSGTERFPSVSEVSANRYI